MTTMNDTSTNDQADRLEGVEFYTTRACDANILSAAPRLFVDDADRLMLEMMGGVEVDGSTPADFTYPVLERIELEHVGVTVVVTAYGKGHAVFLLPAWAAKTEAEYAAFRQGVFERVDAMLPRLIDHLKRNP
jgi:hypothetical protein